MRIYLSIFFLCFFSFRCTYVKKKNLLGVYVPIGYKNTYDTIWLKKDSVYSRKVYDRNNKLVLKTESKYSFVTKDIVQFYNFFINADRDVIRFPELLQDTLGGQQSQIEVHGYEVQFCVGLERFSREYCYRKIE